MALWKPTQTFLWNDRFVVDRIARNMAQSRRSVLVLPRAYHSSLSAQLYGTSKPRPRFDRIGDAKLLTSIAGIKGLEGLLNLTESMEEAGARLRVRSPAPHLVFNVARKRRHSKSDRGVLRIYEGVSS